MAKPNYQFEKRRRDNEKKAKKEEKRLRKLEKAANPGSTVVIEPEAAEPAAVPVEH
jgi:hypothetical protein